MLHHCELNRTDMMYTGWSRNEGIFPDKYWSRHSFGKSWASAFTKRQKLLKERVVFLLFFSFCCDTLYMCAFPTAVPFVCVILTLKYC